MNMNFEFLNKLRTKKRDVNAELVIAQQKAAQEMRRLRFVRGMLPVSTEEQEDLIIINKNIFVRCYRLGAERGLSAGYPPVLRDTFLEEISLLSSDKAVVSYSIELIPIPTNDAMEEVDAAIYALNCSLSDTKEKDPNLVDTVATADRKNIIKLGEVLHKGEKQFSSTTIVSITTTDMKELESIEIKIGQILKNHSVEYDIPRFAMMKAYRASQLLPVSASDFSVELLSDYAAQLTCMSNPNSVSAETGVIIGVDRITGKQIIIDPRMTMHSTITGATGCGKTVFLLTLLSRFITVMGKRAIFITSKAETMTDFQNVARELNDIATIITIGQRGKYNLNPLQIIYRGTPDDYTYSAHLSLVLMFFNTLFLKGGAGASRNMDGEIALTLKELYKSRGITHDPESWKNANWPNLKDLHDYWQQLYAKDRGNSTLEALINKTVQIDEAWKFLLKPTNVDLSKQFLVFDLSSCPWDVQDAVNGYIVGLLMQMFSSGSNDDNGTVIACDEAGDLMKTESMINFMSDLLRKGRSAGLIGLFATQSVLDWLRNEELASMIKANTSAHYIFGFKLNDVNLPDVQNFYSLSDREISWLSGNVAGDFIARIENMTVPVHNELTAWEKRVILESRVDEKTLYKTESKDVFSLVYPGLKSLVETHGIIISSWTKEVPYSLQKMGFTSKNIQHCIGGGRHNVWLKTGIADSNGMIGNQSIEHKGSVLEIAGELVQRGLDVTLNEHKGVDVSTVIAGKKIGFEFELSPKSAEIISAKLRDGLKDHDEVFFICTTTNLMDITDVVGARNAIPRGRGFAEFLAERLKDTKIEKK